MSGTRQFEANVQFNAGVKIPASASSGYVFTSDGSGNGTWQVASAAGALSNTPTQTLYLSTARVVGTVYTPSATRTTFVLASVVFFGSTNEAQVLVNSVEIARYYAGASIIAAIGFWVPPNQTYEITSSTGATLDRLTESIF